MSVVKRRLDKDGKINKWYKHTFDENGKLVKNEIKLPAYSAIENNPDLKNKKKKAKEYEKAKSLVAEKTKEKQDMQQSLKEKQQELREFLKKDASKKSLQIQARADKNKNKI